MSRERYFKAMLFNEETTYKTDYKIPKMDKISKPQPLPQLPKKLVKPLNASCKSKEAYKQLVPFDLTWTPKEIIRTDPYEVQKKFEKHLDDKLNTVRRTRPRLVLTPAVSLDDVEDPQARDIIVYQTYTSTAASAAKEIAFVSEGIKAPIPDLPAPANPICLPKLRPHAVPHEWRKDSVTWDKQQLRSYVDHDREFWKHIQNKPCTPCQQTNKVHQLRTVRR